MARRKTFYGAAGRALSQDTLSQDRVSRASPQRVETAWGESARWPKGTALPCRPGVTAEEAPREPRRVRRRGRAGPGPGRVDPTRRRRVAGAAPPPPPSPRLP